MLTEADTCRKFVVPKLQVAGWDAPPHAINEQRTFAKTIIFCVDQEHALEMRHALAAINTDLVKDHPDYTTLTDVTSGGMTDMGILTAIRRAHSDDAEVIASIYVESWRAAYAGLLPDRVLVGMSVARQTAQWRAAIRRAGVGRGETILVADNTADGVVGMASCGRARAPALGHEGELFTLYVGLDHLGQGYGRALLDESFRRLAEGGCRSALVWVLAGNPSRFFYAAMGGRRVAARVETLWGADVAEEGFGWPDLTMIRGDGAPCSPR